jgi:hypothetical protein
MDEQLIPVISPGLAEAKPITTPAELARHLLLVVTGRRWFGGNGFMTTVSLMLPCDWDLCASSLRISFRL